LDRTVALALLVEGLLPFSFFFHPKLGPPPFPPWTGLKSPSPPRARRLLSSPFFFSWHREHLSFFFFGERRGRLQTPPEMRLLPSSPSSFSLLGCSLFSFPPPRPDRKMLAALSGEWNSAHRSEHRSAPPFFLFFCLRWNEGSFSFSFPPYHEASRRGCRRRYRSSPPPLPYPQFKPRSQAPFLFSLPGSEDTSRCGRLLKARAPSLSSGGADGEGARWLPFPFSLFFFDIGKRT